MVVSWRIRFGAFNWKIMDEILTGKICPYCGRSTEYVDSSIIYGRSYEMIYLCRDCRAYVGVHKGTDQALGRLANAELREAKKEAHFYFDQIAKTNLINKIWKKHIPNTSNRNKAYLWLSNQLGIPRELCHIGMFDVSDCKRVVELCKPLVGVKLAMSSSREVTEYDACIYFEEFQSKGKPRH